MESILSQPPLSSQIKLLEKELNLKLMERGPRNITLTRAGKLLYKRTKNIINLTEATKKELEDLENGLEGNFALGTNSSSGSILLSKRMIEFHKTCPGVNFQIHEGNTYELLELLNSGIIEVAIVRTPFKMDNVKGIFLEEEPMVAVMSQNNKWKFGKEKINLKDIEAKPIITYRRLKDIIISSCSKEGFKPNIFCENDDARTSLMWAKAGLGIAIIPKSALNLIGSEGLIYKFIDNDNLKTRIGAVWMKDRYLSAIASSFLEVFKQ
ncbi:LysR substrate-binding domain-containing protein [uncultured Clostridium sp.]|uniref:LysR substrate-binding domain-containing protein n=1 Tax=uncultured Clostridium sp. TaxID=59620 RepID=UPI003456DF1B